VEKVSGTFIAATTQHQKKVPDTLPARDPVVKPGPTA